MKKNGPPIAETSPQPFSEFLLDGASIVAAVGLAYIFGWSTKDLIWSFWLTGFCVGYLTLLYSAIRPVVAPGRTGVERVLSAIGAMVSVAFFSLHFGAFNYVYAAILDLLMPLTPQPERVYIGNLTWRGATPFSFFGSLWLAVSAYWPLVFITTLHEHRAITRDISFSQNFEPYKAIVKLHFIVIGLGVCYGLGLESYFLYVVFFWLLYTPGSFWKELPVRLRSKT